ncbi:MAG: tetratricopeptide repeat protein [Deltaproteobacteria bacterium]|nr:tetratricopeptide repeat protein [Deltaproteobacteria bacterium]
MAAKKISRARKRALEDPDEFITLWTKLFNFTAEHKVQVSCALAFLLVLVIVAAVTVYSLKKSENKAFFLLQQGVAKYQALVKAGNPNKAYLDAGKDFGLIMEKYSGRKGGKLARFTYADMCYAAGDYEKAIANFNKLMVDFNDEPFLKNLILSSLGYAYKAKKDYKTSAGYFEIIVTTPDYRIKDEALFNLGELYAEIGDKDKSLDAFKKILSDHSGSMYTEIAKEKIGWHSKS